MKRKEMEGAVGHVAVHTSRACRPSRKPGRFSLRRLFGPVRSKPQPHQKVELETRSMSSLQSPFDPDTSQIPESTRKWGHMMECPLCLNVQPREKFILLSGCQHSSCGDCLREYLRIEITESRVNIACPECAEKLQPSDVRRILGNGHSLLIKYEDFALRRLLVTDPDSRWCPAPDCGYAVIATGCASCPRLKCDRPGCGASFCYHCKQFWHPNQTCDQARAQRAAALRTSSLTYSHESGSQTRLSKDDIKPCPRCSALIVKMDDGSCNHMTCAVCGAEFCWLCMKEISDLHYLSPSGCTFWGKKPWSRKKKILWQLGTLVGAPVGISLIAGIAIPAMIIGIPVWVGRKIHAKYPHLSKHKRNLLIAGGVSASIIVSPVVAGLAVGIGVPILLAYVYGVVPISLCRSGGCGVTTTDSGGVRFDFDDDNEVTVGVSSPYLGGDNQSVETGTLQQHGNPSIGPSLGPSIGEMSMGLSASGSHLNKPEDVDSRTAVHGSLCSYTQHKLEIQADISRPQQKRSSLSSESANLSIDAKSVSLAGDDASVRALAGSICARDVVCPPLTEDCPRVGPIVDSRRFKRQSASVSEGMHENTDMWKHQRSIRSLTEDEPGLRTLQPAMCCGDQPAILASAERCYVSGSLSTSSSTDTLGTVRPDEVLIHKPRRTDSLHGN